MSVYLHSTQQLDVYGYLLKKKKILSTNFL